MVHALLVQNLLTCSNLLIGVISQNNKVNKSTFNMQGIGEVRQDKPLEWTNVDSLLE